jgi:hypothetical protein
LDIPNSSPTHCRLGSFYIPFQGKVTLRADL